MTASRYRGGWPGAVAVALVVWLAACAGGAAPATSTGAGAPSQPAAAKPATAGSPAAASGGSPAAPAKPVELERVTLALSARSLSFLPQLLAKTLGYYEAEGLAVEPIITRSDLQMAGMLSGELDYTCTGGDPIVLAVAEGIQVRTIMTTFESTHFTLVGRKGMDRSQLRGARIGVSRLASSSHLTARDIVKHLGVNPDADVTFFGTGETSTSFAALEAGSIDVAILSPPFSSKLVSEGYAALGHASDLAEKNPFTGLATSSDHLRAKPDQAVRMIRAVLRSLETISRDRARVAEVLISEWEIEPGAVDAAYDEMVRPLRVDGRISDAQFQDYLDRSLSEGLIKTPLKVSDVVDYSFLEQAARLR
jgi:ABC-type nitrate/sulfonate/bicarbonate transport system substrate-binding protein